VKKGTFSSGDKLLSRGVLEIVRAETAYLAGHSYPHLLARPLLAVWFRKIIEFQGHRKLAEILEKAGFCTALVGGGDSIETFACNLQAQAQEREAFHLRAYVAMSEAYNFAVRGSFLLSREWVNPFGRWSEYLVPPLDEFDQRFVAIMSAFSRGAFDATAWLRSDSLIVECFPAIYSGVSQAIAKLRQADSSSPADCLVHRECMISDLDRQFTELCVAYVASGACGWRRHVGRYHLNKPHLRGAVTKQ